MYTPESPDLQSQPKTIRPAIVITAPRQIVKSHVLRPGEEIDSQENKSVEFRESIEIF